MMDNSQNAEERIFEAAMDVFCDHGYDGTKMQMIADKAEISKASLHYYFRSKDKLFEKVVQKLFSTLLTAVTGSLKPEDDIETLIRQLISKHIDMFNQYKRETSFIFSEMMKHEDLIEKVLSGVHNIKDIQMIAERLQIERDAGRIIDISPQNLIINMISMSFYPIIAEPLVKRIFAYSDTEYSELLEQRKQIVADFVLAAIKRRD
ncbi:MAG: helix-turn-helix domain-containing protein [Candidatus Zophobacter franzmannii]|nr:helix-turn-helix domain-containing protein [Candidatus Zophobacter franzmannii]